MRESECETVVLYQLRTARTIYTDVLVLLYILLKNKNICVVSTGYL